MSLAWYPWFVNDWMGSLRVKAMSWAQKGLYRELLDWQWQSPGCKLDANALPSLCVGMDDSECAPVLACFARDDGRIYNPKLREIWLKQKDKSAKAHDSAMLRHHANAMRTQCEGKQNACAIQNQSQNHIQNQKEEEDSSEPAHKTRLDVLRLMPLFSDAQKSSPDFMEQWKMWLDFRMTAKRKPKRPEIMFRQQIKWLQRFPLTEQIEIMSASIRNDWQGLFEPRMNGNAAGPKPQHPQGIDFKTYMAQAGRKNVPLTGGQPPQGGSPC